MHVTGDADTAQAGAFLGGPGVVVIAGTGSMAFGRNGDRHARAGGHGFLLGDEGSAYWIGRAAVRAALRWEDRLGGSELIHRTVLAATGPASMPWSTTSALIRPNVPGSPPWLPPSPRSRARTPRRSGSPAGPPSTWPPWPSPSGAASARRRSRRPPLPVAGAGPLPVAGAGRVFGAGLIWDRFAELTGAARPLADAAVGAALLAARRSGRA